MLRASGARQARTAPGPRGCMRRPAQLSTHDVKSTAARRAASSTGVLGRVLLEGKLGLPHIPTLWGLRHEAEHRQGRLLSCRTAGLRGSQTLGRLEPGKGPGISGGSGTGLGTTPNWARLRGKGVGSPSAGTVGRRNESSREAGREAGSSHPDSSQAGLSGGVEAARRHRPPGGGCRPERQVHGGLGREEAEGQGRGRAACLEAVQGHVGHLSVRQIPQHLGQCKPAQQGCSGSR